MCRSLVMTATSTDRRRGVPQTSTHATPAQASRGANSRYGIIECGIWGERLFRNGELSGFGLFSRFIRQYPLLSVARMG
jgi:hypothetical protein